MNSKRELVRVLFSASFAYNERSIVQRFLHTRNACNLGRTSLSRSFIILKRNNRPLTLTHHWAPPTVVTREMVVTPLVFTRS